MLLKVPYVEKKGYWSMQRTNLSVPMQQQLIAVAD
jgi:hypothetical protein